MLRNLLRAPGARALAALALLLGGFSSSAAALPLISEVLYDATGSDAGRVFVELYGAPGTSLAGLFLEGVNGANGAVAPVLALSGRIPDDGFFVIASDQGDGTTRVAEADLLLAFDFQNGHRKAQYFQVLAERGDTAAGWVCHMGVYKRGSIWYARWFEDGRLRRRSLGTGDRHEAEGTFAILYSKPGDPDPEYGAGGRAGRNPRTFGELVDGWMERVRIDHADKRATVDGYAVQARRWKRRWGRRAPDAVTRGDLMEWRDERLGEVAKRTAKYERSVLLGFLRWAQREGLIPVVPEVDPIKGVPRKRRRPAVLSPDEVRELLDAARSHPRPQVRALEAVVRVAVNTGLRRDELRWIEWEDVDPRQKILSVCPKGMAFSPKSHERREIPLNGKLLPYLRELRGLRPSAQWVCENAELGQWSLGITRWARALFKAAGLYDPELGTLHRLRHTFASDLAGNGTDLETIRDLLGHHSVTVTEIYLHTGMERKRAAVESL